jgi:uncharacterized membrane protein HdeD (DUF308 family)
MKKNLDDVLLISGCVCIVLGVGMLSIPAALIVAGVELIGFGFLVGKKMANGIDQ